jgi:hypothetical protein
VGREGNEIKMKSKSSSGDVRRFFQITTSLILTSVIVTSIATGQDALAPPEKPHQVGDYRAQFTERNVLSGASEANRRFGVGVRFNPAATDVELGNESFEVHVPRNYDPTSRFGLIVWINAGESGEIPTRYRELMEKHNLIWIGANQSGNSRNPFWIRASLAIEAVVHMKRRYNIDPDRVYVSGVSGGGRVSSMAALVFPDIFTGGGLYVIGCNYMKDIKTESTRYVSGFWNKPDSRIVAVAKKRRFAMLTGSEDFNQPGTQLVYDAYKRDGFEYVTYLEEPALTHTLPSAAWYEKAIEALDQPLIETAGKAFEAAKSLESEASHLAAYRAYLYAATHGRQQAFQAEAKAKSASIKLELPAHGEKALSELGAAASAQTLREFSGQWFGFPCSATAATQANAMGVVELDRLRQLEGDALRVGLQKFLGEWGGYDVFGAAMNAYNGVAMKELKATRLISNVRTKAKALKKFSIQWQPSPAIALARLDYELLSTDELNKIRGLDDAKKRFTKLRRFVEEYQGTQAAQAAADILSGANPSR